MSTINLLVAKTGINTSRHAGVVAPAPAAP